MFPHIINSSQAVTCTLLIHASMSFDMASWLVTGQFLLGPASYLEWPLRRRECMLLRWVTTLHHVWFVPFSLLVLYGNGGIRPMCLAIAIVFAFVLAITSRWSTPYKVWAPEEVANAPVPGTCCFRKTNTQGGLCDERGIVELNVNQSYHAAGHVGGSGGIGRLMHMADGSRFYMLWLITCFSIISSIPFLLLRLFSVLVLES